MHNIATWQMFKIEEKIICFWNITRPNCKYNVDISFMVYKTNNFSISYFSFLWKRHYGHAQTIIYFQRMISFVDRRSLSKNISNKRNLRLAAREVFNCPVRNILNGGRKVLLISRIIKWLFFRNKLTLSHWTRIKSFFVKHIIL